MNSSQFRRLRSRNRKQISELTRQIDDAVIEQPKQHRPATAKDVTSGNVFFYNVDQDTFFWVIVGDNKSVSASFLDIQGRVFSYKNAVVEELADEAELRAFLESAMRPSEARIAIEKFLTANPTITLDELAMAIGRDVKWAERVLGTSSVDLDKSTTPVHNVYALIKVLKEGDDIDRWRDMALTMHPSEFIPRMEVRLKELKDARPKRVRV